MFDIPNIGTNRGELVLRTLIFNPSALTQARSLGEWNMFRDPSPEFPAGNCTRRNSLLPNLFDWIHGFGDMLRQGYTGQVQEVRTRN